MPNSSAEKRWVNGMPLEVRRSLRRLMLPLERVQVSDGVSCWRGLGGLGMRRERMGWDGMGR